MMVAASLSGVSTLHGSEASYPATTRTSSTSVKRIGKHESYSFAVNTLARALISITFSSKHNVPAVIGLMVCVLYS